MSKKQIEQVAFNKREAAEYLGIGVELLNYLIKSKQIKFRKIFSKYVISKKSLNMWLEGA